MGGDKLSTPPYSSDVRRTSKRELRYTGRNIPYYPVYPIKESRAIQAVNGFSGCKANKSKINPERRI